MPRQINGKNRLARRSPNIGELFATAAVRRRHSWFRAPGSPLSVSREAVTKPVRDFAPQPIDSYGVISLNLVRPDHSNDQRTATIAGKLYHWRKNLEGRLSLHAGASPW